MLFWHHLTSGLQFITFLSWNKISPQVFYVDQGEFYSICNWNQNWKNPVLGFVLVMNEIYKIWDRNQNPTQILHRSSQPLMLVGVSWAQFACFPLVLWKTRRIVALTTIYRLNLLVEYAIECQSISTPFANQRLNNNKLWSKYVPTKIHPFIVLLCSKLNNDKVH